MVAFILFKIYKLQKPPINVRRLDPLQSYIQVEILAFHGRSIQNTFVFATKKKT